RSSDLRHRTPERRSAPLLTATRSLTKHVKGNSELPRVPELEPLYKFGAVPRHGEVIMIVGRSGSQKSGFALFWTAKMGLPTLYCSADMSGFTASSRLASIQTGHTTEQIEQDRKSTRLNSSHVKISYA